MLPHLDLFLDVLSSGLSPNKTKASSTLLISPISPSTSSKLIVDVLRSCKVWKCVRAVSEKPCGKTVVPNRSSSRSVVASRAPRRPWCAHLRAHAAAIIFIPLWVAGADFVAPRLRLGDDVCASLFVVMASESRDDE